MARLCSHLLTVTCHGKRSDTISPLVPAMASAATPSPRRVEDCFCRKERSIAMTDDRGA